MRENCMELDILREGVTAISVFIIPTTLVQMRKVISCNTGLLWSKASEGF